MNWYYAIEGRAQGPLTESSLKRLAREGEINGGTLVWHPGLEEWEPMAKIQPETVEQLEKTAAKIHQSDDTGVVKRLFGWGKKN